ncbi:hypothetical protein Tco_1114259 [Tanacetum coccineum]|uniref:Xylulose kinase-1 n=1 Tax=Tanacetum coccineum TaxID=301880 RepID=A0ABQ5IVM6_9ASTR
MANLEFYDTHNMVAYLKKIEGSEGFHQIVDFLNSSHIRYALTENPTIYVSLIQQFWNTATARTLDNGEIEITTTIDEKVKIVSKASIRRHLKLEDFDGISNLPTTEIFEQLALMGNIRRASKGYTGVDIPLFPTILVLGLTNVADESASTGVDVRHGGAASTVTSLDAGQGSGNIDKTPTMPHDSPLPRSCSFGDRLVANKEFTHLEEDLEDPSKHGRKIDKIDQDPDISLVQHDAEVQGRHEHDMESDFEFTTAKEVYTAKKEVSIAKPVSTAGASVSTAGASSAKDKGKAIIEEAETIQTKTKLQLEQERLGYEEALRLQAEIDEEERQMISKVQEEANSFNIKEWDDIQARAKADEEFAQRLQSEEREMYSEAKKARLLAALINERKRYFDAQRAEERRNKPLTQAQQRTYMS